MTARISSSVLILLVGAASVVAQPHPLQIDEVFAGANGDSRVQFIEIKVCCPGQNAWGPQSNETVGRARLVFFDAAGTQSGEYVFAADPPIGPADTNGARSVLLGTEEFLNQTDLTPDFTLPPLVNSQGGQVCFTGNPASSNALDINHCLSYGNFVGPEQNDEGGNANGAPASALPILGASSLRRSQNFDVSSSGHHNADFALSVPAPRNSAGATASIGASSLVVQGQNLFNLERFLGNGRTCASCHRAETSFGLSPDFVATLPADDPLFVAETNLDLEGLENSCLLHGPRALILENIDGFENLPFFRGSPHLVNVGLTAPYGQSGEIANLQAFSVAAVTQHLPKTLNRNSDPSVGPLDFRMPTAGEQQALEAFMQSITVPSDQNFDLDRMICAAVSAGADAAQIQRGRNLFFGSAKCSMCHNGPTLSTADGSLGGGAQSFNTGVDHLDVNVFDDCIGGPLQYPDSATRRFNTPTLINVANTAPYFHDNSVAELRDAVFFYFGPEFNQSQAAGVVDGIFMTPTQANDITAFLAALVEPTACLSDDTPPQVNCPANIVRNAPAGVCELSVTVPALTASDNCCVGGITNDQNGEDDASGVYPPGVTTVTWTAADLSGNQAQCSHSVTVVADACCAGPEGPKGCNPRPGVVLSDPDEGQVFDRQCMPDRVRIRFNEAVSGANGEPLSVDDFELNGETGTLSGFQYDEDDHEVSFDLPELGDAQWHSIRVRGDIENAAGQPLDGNTASSEPGQDHHWIDFAILMGDFGQDADVDLLDRSAFISRWNDKVGEVSDFSADHQCDVDIDVFDRTQFLKDWTERQGTNLGADPGH